MMSEALNNSINILDENTQAILLLSSHFSTHRSGEATPLTSIEYGRLARWLKESGFQPKDLFYRFEELMRLWRDPQKKITNDRLNSLLARGMAMGIALEKWKNSGIWIITRSDPDYPKRLKMRLGENSPAFFYGVGNKKLLNSGGLAIVGSRKIDANEEAYTKTVAIQATIEGLNVVSGGARGVDEIAMMAALEKEGAAIGVLSNDLFKAAISNQWRRHLRNNQLVLISPFYPDASFHVGNAMGRNKYIYCLSDSSLIVRSEKDTGGTWSGAIENLKQSWVPMFVKANSKAEGNLALIEKGVLTVIEKPYEIGDWLSLQLKVQAIEESDGGKAHAHQYGIQENHLLSNKYQDFMDERSNSQYLNIESNLFQGNQFLSESTLIDSVKKDLQKSEVALAVSYEIFCTWLLLAIANHGELSNEKINDAYPGISKRKMKDWLDKAETENLIVRLGRKRVYSLPIQTAPQSDLFS